MYPVFSGQFLLSDYYSVNMKIFITRSIPHEGITLLREKGFTVTVYNEDKPIPREEFISKAKNADGIISLLTDKIDKEVINKLNRCKIIANYAVGFNNIDFKYAFKKGIVVTNTPDVLTDSTADLAMALILACTRRIVEADKYIRGRKFVGWKPKLLLGIELKEKVIGILGAGRIGEAVAIRAKSFGTKILYFDSKRNARLEKSTGAKKVSLTKLLKESDIISLHLPFNEDTYHILNKEKLSLLKKSAALINTARGELVDEKHLIKMLQTKKLFAAGFDVYEGEPVINSELLKLENVVLLPHIGSATKEARGRMSLLAAKNIIAVLSGRKPLTPVY